MEADGDAKSQLDKFAEDLQSLAGGLVSIDYETRTVTLVRRVPTPLKEIKMKFEFGPSVEPRLSWNTPRIGRLRRRFE